MTELRVNEVFRLGVEAQRSGKFRKADQYYTAILKTNPKHADANFNMGTLAVYIGEIKDALPYFERALRLQESNEQYWISYICALISLNKFDKADHAFTEAAQKVENGHLFINMSDKIPLIKDLGHYAFLLSKLQNTFQGEDLNQLLPKVKSLYKKFPNSIEILEFLCKVLCASDQKHTAILECGRFQKRNSNSEYSLNQLGNIYFSCKNLKTAIQCYVKALRLNPNYAAAMNNLAGTLLALGKISMAERYFWSTLKMDPFQIDAIRNILSLYSQGINFNHSIDPKKINDLISTELVSHDVSCQVYLAIHHFAKGDVETCKFYFDTFSSTLEKSPVKNMQKQQITFLKGFCNFLAKLLESSNIHHPKANEISKRIFHLGDSHCLSFANLPLLINKKTFQIEPKLTFGAKAFHFSKTANNRFKSITLNHMKSLPPSSKVLLSFGEIDCRIDEGFLHASQKFGINIENLIEETVTNFVKWFAESNKNLNHNLNFFNVPAPIYNPKFSKNLNHKRSHTIKIFNRRLSETVKCQGFNLIDVYCYNQK